MQQDAFILPIDEYKRDLNHLKHYISQMGFFVSKMKGMDIQEAKTKVRAVVKEKLVNPTVIYYERRENLDKHRCTTTLLGYLQDTFSKNEILAPTFTTYINPDVFTSPFSEFMIENKDLRAMFKKREKQEKMKGNYVLATFYGKEQNNAKTYNNGGSGCYGSKGSITYNPTCHSTLTSTVRTQTSISNASNERLLEGNRHYRNCDIILYNLISICSDFDTDLMHSVITKYGLVIPTTQDVIDVITRSFMLYNYDYLELEKKVIPFINKLTDLERCAFVYIGDLYHLNKYNKEFVSSLIDSISCKSINTTEVDHPENFLHTFDETVSNHVVQIFCEQTIGVNKDDYAKVFDRDTLLNMHATAENIKNILSNHSDLIRCFFLTKHVPPSSAFIYDQTRRAIVGSDTDATIFSVDTMVMARFNTLNFNTQSKAYASGVSLFTTKIIGHQLAMLSANLGVVRKFIFTLAMKPEFTFPVYAQTPVAKHYYTFATVQEGMHFAPDKYKYEEKGVHMKNSAHPDIIRNSAITMMRNICLDLYNNKPLTIGSKLQEIIQLETDIINSLRNSETVFLKQADIKTADSYNTPPNVSNYRFHTLWKEVFEPKYGSVEDPNYIAVKLPLALNSKTDLNRWISSIEDKQFAERMLKWLVDNKRKDFCTVMMNSAYIQSYGIPKELAGVVDYKRIVLDLSISRRMIASSLGVYPKTKMTFLEMHGYKI